MIAKKPVLFVVLARSLRRATGVLEHARPLRKPRFDQRAEVLHQPICPSA
jgi:hypothetical protein